MLPWNNLASLVSAQRARASPNSGSGNGQQFVVKTVWFGCSPTVEAAWITAAIRTSAWACNKLASFFSAGAPGCRSLLRFS